MTTIFRITLVFEHEYEISTNDAVIDDKVEISFLRLYGDLNRNYFLFSTFHTGFTKKSGVGIESGLNPYKLLIEVQGNNAPIYDVDVDITSVEMAFRRKYQEIEIIENRKMDRPRWYVSRNGRDNVEIEKDEPGVISTSPNSGSYEGYEIPKYFFTKLDTVEMDLTENERGLLWFVINLEDNHNKLLKEGSKCKLGLRITDENNNVSEHEVVFTIRNMKTRIRPWFTVVFMLSSF